MREGRAAMSTRRATSGDPAHGGGVTSFLPPTSRSAGTGREAAVSHLGSRSGGEATSFGERGQELSWITMGLHQKEGVPRTGLQPARPQTARMHGGPGEGGSGGSRPSTASRQRPVSARPAIVGTSSMVIGGEKDFCRLSLGAISFHAKWPCH